MGMTYLHIYIYYESDAIACSGLQSYKFGFLNTITLHSYEKDMTEGFTGGRQRKSSGNHLYD